MTDYEKHYEDVAFTKVSELTGERHTRVIHICMDDYLRWQAGGGLVQNVLPYLTADEREFLMTGITADEWEHLFSERPSEEGTRNG